MKFAMEINLTLPYYLLKNTVDPLSA